MRWVSASVVSMGFQTVTPSAPLPRSRALNSPAAFRLRMDEDNRSQFLGLRPERVEFRIRQFLPVHAAADRRPA